jgi:GntR family transcriptional regulator
LELFSELKLNDKDPVYQQIIKYIKMQIHLGKLEDGDELPSRREIASMLAINPNTVQKAFKILEDIGLVSTGTNVRSVICITDKIRHDIKDELTECEVIDFINYFKSINLSFKDAVELLTKLW